MLQLHKDYSHCQLLNICQTTQSLFQSYLCVHSDEARCEANNNTRPVWCALCTPVKMKTTSIWHVPITVQVEQAPLHSKTEIHSCTHVQPSLWVCKCIQVLLHTAIERLCKFYAKRHEMQTMQHIKYIIYRSRHSFLSATVLLLIIIVNVPQMHTSNIRLTLKM